MMGSLYGDLPPPKTKEEEDISTGPTTADGVQSKQENPDALATVNPASEAPKVVMRFKPAFIPIVRKIGKGPLTLQQRQALRNKRKRTGNEVQPVLKKERPAQPAPNAKIHNTEPSARVDCLVVSSENEYNPGMPNDYEKFCVNRRKMENERNSKSIVQLDDIRDFRKELEERNQQFSNAKKTATGIHMDRQSHTRVADYQTPTEKTPILNVVQLKNMVQVGQVNDELREDVSFECSKFGSVVACQIVERDEVDIYVQYSAPNEAIQAIQSLNGRFFDGRQVQAALLRDSDMPHT